MVPGPKEQFVQSIEFLGEQDGAPERLLKERLTETFIYHRQIHRAYLARVRYPGDQGVALCLSCTSGSKQECAELVGQVFASIFGTHEHLDVVFISEDEERVLRNVCRPFYSARMPDCRG
jgi:hypothetical protein